MDNFIDKVVRQEEATLINSLKASNKIKLLKFGAKWCGPCNTIKPIISNELEKYGDNIDFHDIDLGDKTREGAKFTNISMAMKISAIPYFILLDGSNDILLAHGNFYTIAEEISKLMKSSGE